MQSRVRKSFTAPPSKHPSTRSIGHDGRSGPANGGLLLEDAEAALVIISLWCAASASPADLPGHKAAAAVAPRCVHTALLSVFAGGSCFFFSPPQRLLGLPMNAVYVDDGPGGTVIKSYKCFSVPSYKRLFILIP